MQTIVNSNTNASNQFPCFSEVHQNIASEELFQLINRGIKEAKSGQTKNYDDFIRVLREDIIKNSIR